MASQIDLGAVVPIGKGDWNASTTYERTNIVRHNSTAWICKVATSTGVEPTEDSSDWYLLVRDTSSVTSVNGMIGDVNINSILENPSTNDNSLKIASTSWVKTKVDNATNELNTQISQVSFKASTALQTANTANSTADNALSKAEEASNKAGLPLGHIYLWPFSTPPDGSIQLNGSTYSRELYSDLWALIQEKNWYKPESEWQSIASANGGYCPWYSDGDGSTTFRTPKFAPYQKLALASGDAGKYYEAGLPNITGDASLPIFKGVGTGAFITRVEAGNSQNISGGSGGWKQHVGNAVGGTTNIFDASRANTIYGNSTTVQPESHDWIICTVAFGTVTNVGSVDVADVMSAVSQVQAKVSSKLEDSTVHVIKTWKSEDGTSWYRKWSDGFIEQGGYVSFQGTSDGASKGINVTFPTPFSTTTYTVVCTPGKQASTYSPYYAFGSQIQTTTSVKFGGAGLNKSQSIDQFRWYACGY